MQRAPPDRFLQPCRESWSCEGKLVARACGLATATQGGATVWHQESKIVRGDAFAHAPDTGGEDKE